MQAGQIAAPILSDEEKEKIRQQLNQAEGASAGGENERKLEKAIEEQDAKNLRESLGLDLDFDVKAFITQGVIVKKGIKVNDKMFVDMKTLTTKERMVAEALVRDRFPGMKLDTVYLTAIEAAMVAMSITRINNVPFENPDVSQPLSNEVNKGLYAGKNKLFDMLMESSNEVVTMLSVIYKNLEAVSTPSEKIQKKS
jgi:hypothetical protein